MKLREKEQLMKEIIDEIEDKKQELIETSKYIWNNPEIGYEEFKAKDILISVLEKEGFEIQRDVGNVATAFTAVKKGKGEGPRIAIMSEYDALPEIGHACGHNLFSVASIGAALGIAKVIDKIDGSVVVIGTPAEEGIVPNSGGKAVLIEEGVFENIDAAMICHAEGRTIVERLLVASASIEVIFTGKAAHAGGPPHEWINALTAGLLTINNINAIRQQFLPRVIVNPIITEGGITVNTIPDKCVVKLSIRADRRNVLLNVMDKVENCIKAAAMVTGCNYKIDMEKRIYEDLIPNHELSLAFRNALNVLGVDYIEREEANYAWDAGNVSYVCPTIAPYIKIGSEKLVGHTEDFKKASNSEEGFEGMIIGAKAMALTTFDYLTSPDLRERAKEEFQRKISSNS
ncbi:M20 family metallopeptidase [Proteiniborus sp. MB09-C3]|uniref:M20 family metallopeptidase n=1 Tax=Proteiniborus sp. MB09-C3 TaxID=3050072 RepID=UPI002556205D|nr:M20 family metallopeptidase [Proteiniborus sp. MB09-C3]WIV13541.1 M20 family metallopeptidase [Proteiniborus sp. MB09-C3]